MPKGISERKFSSPTKLRRDLTVDRWAPRPGARSKDGHAFEHRGCMREFFSMSSSLMSTIGRRVGDQGGRRPFAISDEDGSGHLVTRSQPSRILCTQNFVILNDQDTILQCVITLCCCFCCVPNHVPHKYCDIILARTGQRWMEMTWGRRKERGPIFNGGFSHRNNNVGTDNFLLFEKDHRFPSLASRSRSIKKHWVPLCSAHFLSSSRMSDGQAEAKPVKERQNRLHPKE